MDLGQTVQLTKLFQDVEFSQAVQALNQNPQALQVYLQQAQDKLYKDITAQKDNTMTRAYGDLVNAKEADEAVITSWQRTKDTDLVQGKLLDEIAADANGVVHDRDLAKRQTEINEWSYGNKRDTLFVYQALFIGLCLTILLTFLWSRYVIGGGFYSALVFMIALVFALIVVDRAQYTNFLRDKRYWNRRIFNEEAGKAIPVPSCESAEAAASDAYNSAAAAIQNMTKGL
jgi:hypothetical protein